MGGIILADPMARLYDLNCKSLKWWKKVFYRFLLFAAVNLWVVHKELQRWLFLDLLGNLSENLIAKECHKLVTKKLLQLTLLL